MTYTPTFDYFTEDGEGLTDYELHERYDEMLDECYGTVSIAGLDYDTARTLKDVDPIAYRCGFCDWLDSEIGETLFESDPTTDDDDDDESEEAQD